MSSPGGVGEGAADASANADKNMSNAVERIIKDPFLASWSRILTQNNRNHIEADMNIGMRDAVELLD
jgi:hypothetical protein